MSASKLLNESRRTIALGVIGLLVLVLLMSPFILFDTVDETEYGLKYSTWTSSLVDEEVYTGGRYYTGLFQEFITFPATQQTIDFTSDLISGRTSDGLAIFLEISFQYQLPIDAILALYRNYGQAYEPVFTQISRDSIRDSTSGYTAIEFFNNRTLIGTFMEDLLAEAFLDSNGVNIPAFQLRSIDLPDSFEDALERAEVARQEIEIARLEQEEALIRAETLILEAQAQANVTRVNAQAEAEAYVILIEAQAEALNITLTAQQEAYYGLSQSLNLTSSELLAFLWVQALQQIGEYGNLIIIGESTPELLLNTENSNSTKIF